MKYLLVLAFIMLAIKSFSQKTISSYIEVRGNVDALGNIYFDNIIKPRTLTKTDSLIDYSQFKEILHLREPIKIINKLSENGWILITVTHVSSDKENRPNSPFLLYYFKKEFEL